MSNNFMSAMKNTLNDEYNVSVTENGAVGYRTSGKELLDLNFAVSSLRRATPADIAARFTRAFFEDQVTAMKWLFFARDIRGGLGERRLFRVVLEYMAKNSPEYVKPVIRLVPNHCCQLFRDCLNGEVNSYPWCSRQESNLRWRPAFLNIAVRVPKAHTFYSRCLTT